MVRQGFPICFFGALALAVAIKVGRCLKYFAIEQEHRFSLIPSPGAYIKILPQSSYILTTLGQLQFYKSLYITTTPTFSHINRDVQSAKFNKNSDEYHARTYIYSDEKRKTARHNLTINPSSILSGRHILHLPYDMHIVQRLKS